MFQSLHKILSISLPSFDCRPSKVTRLRCQSQAPRRPDGSATNKMLPDPNQPHHRYLATSLLVGSVVLYSWRVTAIPLCEGVVLFPTNPVAFAVL